MKTKPPNLTPATIKLIERIESEKLRKMLLLGLDPGETVEGWYMAIAGEIVNLQEGR